MPSAVCERRQTDIFKENYSIDVHALWNYAKIDVPEYKRWNKLHNDLKNSTTVNMFKKRNKTFVLSEYAATSFIAEIAISTYFIRFV